VHFCRSHRPTCRQQRRTFLKNNKIYRLNRVSGAGSILVALALFGLPMFAQTSSPNIKADVLLNSRTDNTDEASSQSPSPYVVSVSQLRAPTKAIGHLQAAERHFAKMELAQATVELNRAVSVDPSFAPAFRIMALVHLAEKDFTGSVESGAQAIRLDSADAYSWIALATAYNSLNEWPEAEAAAGRALALNPSAWQGRLELAKSFYGEGKFVLALQILDQLNRNAADIHLIRANSLMRLGRQQEAAQQFWIFLQQAPGDSRAEQIRHIISGVKGTPN
jgi:tetratricopeptide (TPR) repeat protein